MFRFLRHQCWLELITSSEMAVDLLPASTKCDTPLPCTRHLRIRWARYSVREESWIPIEPGALAQGVVRNSHGESPAPSYGINEKNQRHLFRANPNGAILKSTTYNPAGQVTQVTHANGDNEVYTFDPNTSRMNQYQYNIGATPTVVTGALTWNPNGTLQALSTTDGFNAANTQSCVYGYDSLLRIASVNCTKSGGVNVWNQVFAYDAFGNVTKTVPTGGTGIAFTPRIRSDHESLSQCDLHCGKPPERRYAFLHLGCELGQSCYD